MSESIIEQVRKAANRTPIIKTVEQLPVSTRQEGPYFPRKRDYDELDLRLVLAHMQAQQAVVEIAIAINQGYKNWVYEIAAKDKQEHALAEGFFSALDAALEKVKS